MNTELLNPEHNPNVFDFSYVYYYSVDISRSQIIKWDLPLNKEKIMHRILRRIFITIGIGFEYGMSKE